MFYNKYIRWWTFKKIKPVYHTEVKDEGIKEMGSLGGDHCVCACVDSLRIRTRNQDGNVGRERNRIGLGFDQRR